MTLQVVYSVSAGVTSDISDRVFMASERLGLPPFSITQNAEEGSVAHSTLVADDPSGSLVLKGHRRVYFVETSAPAGQQVIGNTYVGAKEISRGDWRVGPLARTFSVSLQDANTLISRRLIVGSDGNRPAETDIQRLTWLLATTEANEFNGPSTYINTAGPVAMDKVDYRGQSVAAILSDLSQASHKNWWIVYFEGVGQFGLWYDWDYSATYDSALRLSNDPADIDDSTTFAYFPTATLTQDPSRVYSGGLIEFQPADSETTSWVYDQRIATGNEFVFRDFSYPSINVKTAAKARARLTRYFNESDSEDDVVKVSFVVPAATVNGLMHGMRIQTKGTHWGFTGGNDYTPFTQMRCMNRTVTQMSSTHYRIDAELSPIPPNIEPFAVLYRSQTDAIDPGQTTPISWVENGDTGHSIQYPYDPTIGSITFIVGQTPGVPPPPHGNYLGMEFGASGEITFESTFTAFTACGGQTVRVNLLLNGVVVSTGTVVTTAPGPEHDIVINDTISVVAGDQLTAEFVHEGSLCAIYIDYDELRIVGTTIVAI